MKLLKSINYLNIILFILIFPWVGIPIYPYLLLFLASLFLLNPRNIRLSYSTLCVVILLFALSFVNVFLYKNYHVILYTLMVLFIYIFYFTKFPSKIRGLFNFSRNKRNIIIVFLILSYLLINATWGMTSHKGRFAVFVGDPNFTALWLSTMLMVFYNIVNGKKVRLIIFLCMLSVILLTGSRMVVVSILIFFISLYFIEKGYRKTSLFIGISILVTSIIGQQIAYYIFDHFLKVQNLKSDNVYDRLMNLNDTSNLLRFSLYNINRELLFDNFIHILIGVPNELLKPLRPPHNWFMMLSVRYGLVYGLIVSNVLLKLIIRKQNKFTPIIYSVIFMAGMLNMVGILAPMIFVLIFELIYNRKSIHNGTE